MTVSLKRELRLTLAMLADQSRYVDMRIEFRTHPDANGRARRLLSAGGRWDTLLRCWAPAAAPPGQAEVWTPADGWGRTNVLREKDLEALPANALCLAHVVTVEPSQEAYTIAFGEWLYAYANDLPRPAALDLLAGNRRGGKTWIAVACVVAAGIACPSRIDARDGHRYPFVGWMVVPGYPEQREIHEDLRAVLAEKHRRLEEKELRLVTRELDRLALPSEWFSYHPNPNNVYRFRHGAEIYLKSANHADSLKQGRVDIAMLNEAQKMDGDSTIHCLGNCIDGGGLVQLVANPPRKVRGQWLLDLYEAHDEKRTVIDGWGSSGATMRCFFFNPDQNTRINQPARQAFKLLSSIINSKLANADAEGAWSQIGDKAYGKFVPKENTLTEIPSHWQDVTPEVVGAMGLIQDELPRRPPRGYKHFAGADFNKYPWMAAGRLKSYRDPSRPTERRPRGEIIHVLIDDWRSDPESQDFTTERGFAEELQEAVPDGAGWDPEDTVFIGDATSQWQNSDDRKKGGVEAGESGFDRMREKGWEIHAPTTIRAKERTRKGGSRTKTKNYRPPRRIESVDLINQLCEQKRFYVLVGPDKKRCKHSVEALKKCDWAGAYGEGGKPTGLYAHMTDAIRYPIWRAESGINPANKEGPAPLETVTARPPGIEQQVASRKATRAARAQPKKKAWM